jgi:elongation factor Ts
VATIDKNLLTQLRDITGLGMMDCKKALEETNGDIEASIELLRKKGAAVALKRCDKGTSEGLVHAYIHPGSRVGVLIEINCETDFVARTEAVEQFAHDVCLHIAAMKPMYLDAAQVDPTFLEHEKEILREQLAGSGKPAKVIDQILEGKVQKMYTDICLLEQTFVKNDQKTIKDLLQELIAKTGENIKIRRFSRFEISA